MNFRNSLIESVSPQGREEYRQTLEAIGDPVGREGRIAGLNLRVIKGINQLQLSAACLTTEGLATEDGMITDCSAAMVRRKNDGYERYSGKDTPHATRISPAYNQTTKEFSLWSTHDDGRLASIPRSFHASILSPRSGDIVSAKFGNEILSGVLEDGPLTEHIRACLADFEKDVESIGILLRHPHFHRASDTRQNPVPGIDTLYSDGAQLHAMNRRTVLDWQNANISRAMAMASYRAGIEIDGEQMLPNIEDLILRIRVLTQQHGDVPLDFTSLTPRCPVTQRDLRTGKMESEPKIWNRKHRPLRPWDDKPTFGANADMQPEYNGAVIRVGDRFTVESEKTEWLQ